MKILVQSDDYGLTKGIVDACCDAFENGILRNTGIFMNMPSTEYAVSKMKYYPNVCFGIDINVSTGPCVADKNLLPNLVNQETGEFIQVSERIKDPEFSKKCYRPYEEVLIEARAQIDKFIKLVGHKPEYIQTHSSSGEYDYFRALEDVSKEYGIKYKVDVCKKYGFVIAQEFAISEKYKHELEKYSNPKEAQQKIDMFTVENQMLDEIDPTIRGLEKLLNEKVELVYLGSHCGWVSADLFRYSRSNINRAFDHEFLTSSKIMDWIKANNIELITYRNL